MHEDAPTTVIATMPATPPETAAPVRRSRYADVVATLALIVALAAVGGQALSATGHGFTNERGPRGAQGRPGEIGPPGPQGRQGPAGTAPAGQARDATQQAASIRALSDLVADHGNELSDLCGWFAARRDDGAGTTVDVDGTPHTVPWADFSARWCPDD